MGVKTCLEAGGQLHLEDADNGPGIPRRLCGSVFEEMFTTKGSGGTGLGLPVSYSIIKEHGGEIEVESAPGRGTTFRVLLRTAG